MLSMRFARRFICTVVLCACLRGQGTEGNQKAQHKNVCINCTCYDQHKNKYNLWPLQNLDDPENPRFVSYYIIRDHTKLRRRGQRERQKRSNLMSNTKALHVLHAFLQFSLPFLLTMTWNHDQISTLLENGNSKGCKSVCHELGCGPLSSAPT